MRHQLPPRTTAPETIGCGRTSRGRTAPFRRDPYSRLVHTTAHDPDAGAQASGACRRNGRHGSKRAVAGLRQIAGRLLGASRLLGVVGTLRGLVGRIVRRILGRIGARVGGVRTRVGRRLLDRDDRGVRKGSQPGSVGDLNDIRLGADRIGVDGKLSARRAIDRGKGGQVLNGLDGAIGDVPLIRQGIGVIGRLAAVTVRSSAVAPCSYVAEAGWAVIVGADSASAYTNGSTMASASAS